MEVKLLVLNGKQKDREVPLPRTIFLIGRDQECHLRLHSLIVSRRHCAIACWAGKVAVRDLKSANGTFINNQRVVGEVKVTDGDRLQVGPLAFCFRVRRTAPEAPPGTVSPGSLRWLLEHAREVPLDLNHSTKLGEIPVISGADSEPEHADLAGAVLSPGAPFFKCMCHSAQTLARPVHLLRSVPPPRVPPAAGPERNG
jgi:pSer/pThr/pTyr-binding forkhead associated (FHA) protein